MNKSQELINLLEDRFSGTLNILKIYTDESTAETYTDKLMKAKDKKKVESILSDIIDHKDLKKVVNMIMDELEL